MINGHAWKREFNKINPFSSKTESHKINSLLSTVFVKFNFRREKIMQYKYTSCLCICLVTFQNWFEQALTVGWPRTSGTMITLTDKRL